MIALKPKISKKATKMEFIHFTFLSLRRSFPANHPSLSTHRFCKHDRELSEYLQASNYNETLDLGRLCVVNKGPND